MSENTAMCFSVKALFDSILVRCEQLLSTSPAKGRFFRHRDTIIEDQTESALASILGDEAKIFRNLFETPDNHYEHDLVVVTKELCLFVEVKASPPHEPFRDPEKAFNRIRRDFRSDRGIQKAYEQSLRLLKTLKRNSELILYDREGKETLRLSADVANNAFCVCVTRDSFGPVATYLSWLLEKDHEDPYPWCVNILDLENIAKTWNYLAWDARQLKTYVSQRTQFHTNIFAADELDYVGAFMSHCGLQHFTHSGLFVQLVPYYADIIHNILAHLHYGAPAVTLEPAHPISFLVQQSFEVAEATNVKDIPKGPINVGRNERCPCDSEVKFKRCHGK